jgi:hypothetical protein
VLLDGKLKNLFPGAPTDEARLRTNDQLMAVASFLQFSSGLVSGST